jgi:hypothetical protein
MSIPTKCSSCGYSYRATSIHIENSTAVTVSGSETCPKCGGRAEFQAGTYDFIGDSIAVLRSASQDDIRKLKGVAAAAAAGEIDRGDAIHQSDEIHEGFGQLLATALKYGVPSLLVALISLYLQYGSMKEDERDSAEMRNLLRQQAQTSGLLLKEFQRINELQRTSPPPQQLESKPQTVRQQPNVTSLPNRHERRAAAARAKGNP